MGTLVQNAAAVKAASTAIDAAIVAKGGTTAGGLTNAAAAIAALPSGGWPIVPWREDGKCHFWFQIPNNPNKTISFFFEIISNGNVEVNWGDGQTDTVSGSASFSSRTFTHTYSAQGDYEVVMTNITSVRLSDWNFGNIGGGVTRDYIRQIEFDCACVLQNGNWYHFRYLPFLCGVRMASCNLISSQCFETDVSLASVGDLSACTSIGGSAFYGCASLASVGDLSACTSIGGGAFYGCSSLASVGDLSACTSIGESVFRGCFSLASVGDLSACTSIGNNAFYGCSSLASVGDLSACTSIGGGAFYGCSSLASVGDLSACTSIGGGAFDGCSDLVSLNFTRNLTTIESRCFASFSGHACESLESLGDLSAVVLSGEYEFFGCSALTSLNLSGTNYVGNGSFYGCSHLRSLTLGTLNNIYTNDGALRGIGSELEPIEGISTTITIGNTMASFRALNSSAFPYGARTDTKFVCADGYIIYENGAWTNHPNA